MMIRFSSQQFGWIFKLVRFLLASAMLVASMPPSWALAQTTDDPWDEPLNLSRSGIAKNPAFVVDSEGIGHVVWQDDLANFMYTRFDGEQWSVPAATNLNRLFNLPLAGQAVRGAQPMIYTGPNPLFMPGPGPQIFAFWLSPQGKLFTSKVRNTGFENVVAWDPARLIAPEVASFTAAVDARGEWHLAYLRTVSEPKNPAGIYYTHTQNGGWTWKIPKLLYESTYFHRLSEGEANLSLAIAESESMPRVYLAWDNRPRRQVFLAQSVDGGESWEEPVVVAGPVQDAGLTGPFNIHVGIHEKSVVLVWQSGGRATNGLLPACSQIYQHSSDFGTTWSKPHVMIESLLGCAPSDGFVTGLSSNPGGLLYFLTKTKGQVYLSAWNDTEWSEPQAQPVLSGFDEPEIYTEVIYGCHRANFMGERLYVVGCDQGEGGDVWVTSRDLGSSTTLFEPPIWSQVSPVTSENLAMEAIELVATDDGLFHAFFSRPQGSDIYYTYWKGELWSRVTPVVELPNGTAGRPAIAAGPGNELFLIAPNSTGELYFSRATSGNAATESLWSTPKQLATGLDGKIGSADVAWDAAGTLYVAYSIPVNEERGIYLVQSKDHGTSWSAPVQVFNGATAGADFVGAPTLLKSENGLLHIIWKQQSIQGDGVSQPLSLYHTRSEDDGLTFSAAEPVVKEPVTWQAIAADHKGQLHVLWQDNRATVWDQVSLDGGRSWQFPQGLPEEGMTATTLVDSVGRLHLLTAAPDSLSHWLWEDGHWQPQTPLQWSLASQQEGPVELLITEANKNGQMVVILKVPTGAGETMLLYSTNTLKLPPRETEIEEISTQTPSAPISTLATPSPELLTIPTASHDDVPANQDQNDNVPTGDSASPLALALIPVGLILLSVLGIAIWRATRTKDQ